MLKPAHKTEVLAGITTFLTMSYIIAVNPMILATEGTGMVFSGVLTATVLLAFTMSVLMGVYAKLPVAVAPGMGLNAFVAFGLILGQKIPWQTAMGMIFWAGVFFLIISVTGLRSKIISTFPKSLTLGASCGIGLFLAFIGLKNSGLIVSDPVTFVKMGQITGPTALSAVGLLVSFALMQMKKPYAFIVGILFVTLLSFIFGFNTLPSEVVLAPDFSSVFLKLDLWGSLQFAYVPIILSIVLTDFFDSVSTFLGVAQASQMLDENGRPLRLKQGLIVDAWATLLAGVFGTSSGTAFIESATGIEAGGRTGLTSIVTGLLFLPFLFLAPLVAVIPMYATAPILICVGLLMLKNVSHIEFDKYENWVPALFTLVMIPMTFSITKGFLLGVIVHSTLQVIKLKMDKNFFIHLFVFVLSAGALYLLH